jgi:Tachylectin
MKIFSLRRSFATTVILMAFSIGLPLIAQLRVRVVTPGTTFNTEGAVAPGVVQDVPGGRRFRGRAGSLLKVRAVMRIPAGNRADMQRLVVHFRTNPGGPRLRKVEVLNGSSPAFSLATDLAGDYVVRETPAPDVVANLWDFKSQPRGVSSQTIIRLEVQFPVGFDSAIDPGEFVLTGVGVDFPRSLASDTIEEHPPIVALPAGAAVVYAVPSNSELMWYRHDGHNDGSFRWSGPKKVGVGWTFKQMFSGGDGVIYGINDADELMWYRHDGHSDGSFRWSGPKKVGTGWTFKQIFSGGGGVIYGINDDGELMWYRHDGHADGSFRWSGPKKVGTGWAFKQVFYGGDGVIYGINDADELMWYRHDGHADGSFRWSGPKKVGTGWTFKQVFYGGDGVIYGINDAGELMWYRHDGHADGSLRWSGPKKVGSGWEFSKIFVDGPTF